MFFNAQRYILGMKGPSGKVKLLVNHPQRYFFPSDISSELGSGKGRFDLIESSIMWENLSLISEQFLTRFFINVTRLGQVLW